MTILHLDSGRDWRGGQVQMRRLIEGLEARSVTCAVQSPLMTRRADKHDLIHCHDARTHTFALVSPMARRPFVVSRRVGFPIGRSWLSRWKYSRAAKYLAVSRFVADRLMEANVPASKIEVVYDGVPKMPRTDRSSGRVLALSKSGVGVPGAIPVADLERDLSSCDVLIYWSEMEGLGSAALLAQAAGVPVVARRVGGLPEAVKFGVLVDRLDEIPAAVERAREIEVDVETIGREFGVDRMVDRTLGVYREALA
jgi:hypothetical protein